MAVGAEGTLGSKEVIGAGGLWGVRELLGLRTAEGFVGAEEDEGFVTFPYKKLIFFSTS